MGSSYFSDVTDLLEYWHEFPPTFMLVRGAVGFEPRKSIRRSSGARSGPRRKVESSDEHDKAAFVAQWGGTVMHPDSLPLAVQGGIALAIAEMERENARQ